MLDVGALEMLETHIHWLKSLGEVIFNDFDIRVTVVIGGGMGRKGGLLLVEAALMHVLVEVDHELTTIQLNKISNKMQFGQSNQGVASETKLQWKPIKQMSYMAKLNSFAANYSNDYSNQDQSTSGFNQFQSWSPNNTTSYRNT
jgi:hypothetical protein